MNTEKKILPTSRAQSVTRPLTVVLGLTLALWLLSWFVVPSVLKAQLETRLGEQLGRQVTVGQVDFKPWSLEFTLNDVSIQRFASGSPEKPAADQLAATPQLSIKRIYIDVELQSLLRLAPVVDAISVEEPHLRLTHIGQGHYDVDDVLTKLAASPDKPDDPQASPLRFALYNLVLSDGVVEFSDAPLGQGHQLRHLQISLPFLSNLDSKREVQVQPKLAFNLNGSQFDSDARSTPFATNMKTDAKFQVKDLDLAPYLSYLPAGLPVQLAAAVLNADMTVAFEQSPQAAVTLSGQIQASGVKVTAKAESRGTAAPELLAFDQLNVQLTDVRPLAQNVKLGLVALTRPRVTLHRDRAGGLNWLALAKPEASSKNTLKNIADHEMDMRAGGQKDAQVAHPKNAPSWKINIDRFTLNAGEVLWRDDALAKPLQLSLSDVNLQASAITWPMLQPMPLTGKAQLAGATLDFSGTATDQAAEITARLTDVPLSLAAPYAAEFITPKIDGMLKTEFGLRWTAATAAQATQTKVQVASLSLDKLDMRADKKSLASIRQLKFEDVALDLGPQTVNLGRVQVKQPKAAVVRLNNGRWMFQDWLKAQSGSVPSTASAHAIGATGPDKAWSWVVNDLQVTDGALTLEDNDPPQPVELDVTGLVLQVKNLSSAIKTPFGVRLAARVRHGNTEAGKLTWVGTNTLNPISIKGDLTAQRLPLHALAPYGSDVLNMALLRADTSFKGKVAVAQQATGMAVTVVGDAHLEDLQVQTLAQAAPFKPAEDLLNWKSLSLTGFSVVQNPGTAMQVEVQGTVLRDFYAKVVLSEAGRLNLQDVAKPAVLPPEPALSSAPVAAASVPQLGTTATAPLEPVIRFGPVSLLGGRVDFTDRFIKPNYSADLTELTGTLSAFASKSATGEVQLADLVLRGRAEGSATLEVLGKINPLVQPLALDIKGKVRDLELAPLSTYSVRYAGYGIERGKLSVDVAYQVQPDGMLTANNNIVLNQLKFGDKVPDATSSLPVKLAVALLADRNGVIDINLPVSGSLNDPQFRLMPIVFRVLGNLIVKAITSPFSLLSSALGGAGGDALSMVSFDAGSAVLTPQAKIGLDKVAKALQERTTLKMTVVGTASLEAERDAYKRSQLQALVLAEKRRADPAGEANYAQASVSTSSPEYPVLLQAVYKRGNFPKPRNLIGLAKDLPVPEIQALLLANLEATEPAMQALALKRGLVVRDYLSSLKLPAERLFLGAAKAVAADAKWHPRAELSLATE